MTVDLHLTTIIMGLAKTELFTPEQNLLANQLKALAHPARVAIFQLLLRRKSCVCGSITDELGLSQSTVSQHLKVMKQAGIVRGIVEGTAVCYCLDGTGCADLFQRLTGLKQQLDCC